MRVPAVSCLFLLLAAGPAAAATLADAPVGARVTVPAFEWAPGKAFAGDVVLQRIDVYARDARIVAITADGAVEVPRSRLQFFINDAKHTASRMYFAVDPASGRVSGALFDTADGVRLFEGSVDKAGRLAISKSAAAPSGLAACGGSPTAAPLADAGSEPLRFDHLVLPKATAALSKAVVAVDTDNELFEKMFGGTNTAAATDYIAELFAGVNAVYQADLELAVEQGATRLRTTAVTDPFVQTDMFPLLSEFGGHWMTNEVGTPRAFATLISGKSPSPNSSSGLAWLLGNDNYCSRTGNVQAGNQVAGHYSVNQIFTNLAFKANNVWLVGHELGHNLGAAHTHCTNKTTLAAPSTSNTIDQCFSNAAFDPGCYDGPRSCPNEAAPFNGAGSMMSYCHFPAQIGGPDPGCNPTQLKFHPVHQTLLAPKIATNLQQGCFSAVVENPFFFFSGFEPGEG